jgi:hypothetical protein
MGPAWASRWSLPRPCCSPGPRGPRHAACRGARRRRRQWRQTQRAQRHRRVAHANRNAGPGARQRDEGQCMDMLTRTHTCTHIPSLTHAHMPASPRLVLLPALLLCRCPGACPATSLSPSGWAPSWGSSSRTCCPSAGAPCPTGWGPWSMVSEGRGEGQGGAELRGVVCRVRRSGGGR